jgi:hypothetical protein
MISRRLCQRILNNRRFRTLVFDLSACLGLTYFRNFEAFLSELVGAAMMTQTTALYSSSCPQDEQISYARPKLKTVHDATRIIWSKKFSYFLVQRSSPLLPPLREGLALLPRPASLLPGSHPPPPPSFLAGWSLLSSLCPARRDETSSFEARRRCMKLQKPPRLHSPFSFWRQQASRKSVTGESSAYSGRPDNES